MKSSSKLLVIVGVLLATITSAQEPLPKAFPASHIALVSADRFTTIDAAGRVVAEFPLPAGVAVVKPVPPSFLPNGNVVLAVADGIVELAPDGRVERRLSLNAAPYGVTTGPSRLAGVSGGPAPFPGCVSGADSA